MLVKSSPLTAIPLLACVLHYPAPPPLKFLSSRFHMHCSPPGMCSSMPILKFICICLFHHLFLPFHIPPPHPLFPSVIPHTNSQKWMMKKGILHLSPPQSCSLSLIEKNCLHCVLCSVGNNLGLISTIWIPPSRTKLLKESSLLRCRYFSKLSTCF